ncbi:MULTISPECIES: fibronectin type III domain-containing protein [Streptomyces]|uniref:Fibronectin type III domain-containing protein n=1 Tax=Streptomyces katrae TaxID=68223 RepID=A0ABT7GYK5_9ACTN|nr:MULTISPECIES: fibronectin type III domain-containing protein [Streptomyces]MDK9497959.1 fibronectin type III domain-containing protein [Streptomyces katrae]GLX16467.1 hydrolase [Streptomyces lavendulae subsp. lavendulae]GLX25087.1 hydrolase [Streptomyces lavendulae subsp. lavendulae]
MRGTTSPRRAGAAALALGLAAALAACGTDGDTRPPPAPTGLTAQAGSATSVHVMWRTPATADGVSGYQVFQGGQLVRELPADKTMTDITGLAPGTAYTFTVRAKDAAGNRSPLSAPAGVTTPAAKAEDHQAPTAPPTATGRAEGPHEARLSWGAATDDTGVTAYDVYQAGVRVHTAPGTDGSTTVTGLQPGTAYVFTVRARDGSDNSSPDGPPVAVTTPADPGQAPDTAPGSLTATASPGAVELAWTAPGTGRTTSEYQLYVNDRPVTVIQFGAGAVPEGRASYRLTTTEPAGTVWTVKLRARLPDGNWGAFSEERRILLAG